MTFKEYHTGTTYIRICIFTYRHKYVCTSCMHTNIHIHTHTYIHRQTHTHTYMHPSMHACITSTIPSAHSLCYHNLSNHPHHYHFQSFYWLCLFVIEFTVVHTYRCCLSLIIRKCHLFMATQSISVSNYRCMCPWTMMMMMIIIINSPPPSPSSSNPKPT